MSENNDQIQEVDNEEKPKIYPTQLSLTIRVIVGGYVLYNMYGILKTFSEHDLWLNILAVVLSVVGLVLIVLSLKNLVKGEYEGGKADTRTEEHEDGSDESEETDDSEIENVNDIAEVIEP